MKKNQFRFKTQFFTIEEIYSVPGLVVCSGHGYEFQTFCCSECGEIYVLDMEAIGNNSLSLPHIAGDMKCPKCNVLLRESLVKYPENIFYKGRLLKNMETIDKANFDETFLQEVYQLK